MCIRDRVYLAQVRGYNALMIGETLFVTGLTQFISAPICGRLMSRMDPRLMIMIGFAALGLSSYMMTDLTRDWDYWELFVPQILRGFGLMFAMVPINNIALGALPPERIKNASGLYNLTRNLGGAVGLAVLNTMLNDRTDLHTARLHEAVTWSRQPVVETLNGLTQNLSSFGSAAPKMALQQLYLIVHRQGMVMAFADVFWALALLYGLLAGAVYLMKRPAEIGAGGSGGGH